MRSDLELLRAVVDIEGLSAVNRQDFHLAAEVTARLLATQPAPKPFAPSGAVPESNTAFYNRLPIPEKAFRLTPQDYETIATSHDHGK